MSTRAHRVQLIGSLAVAAAIVAIAIAVVTSKFGTTSAAERELQEERLEQREEIREERLDRREELRQERLDRD
jgi:bifunctional ADP-heptose synthase (sugar kinase/adenylyltransferase)